MPAVGELKLAFDGTVRSVDKDGHLHLSKTHISKATVNGYLGSEIPGADRLGLISTQIYYMFRDPLELARAASTFARKPVLSRHIPVNSDEPHQELIVGSIGSDVEFNDPYLDADVTIWEASAIAGIETDTVREFSCAYRYVAVMNPGEYHGQRYDGVMTEIAGNHLALVETGRAGSDVMAADEAIKTMKTTKLGKALFVTLGALSPKLAQDSLLKLVGEASGKTLNVGEMSTALMAMDAELDPKLIKTTVDALIALDMSSGPSPFPAEDEEEEEDEEDEKKKEAKDKKMAKDAEEKDEKDKKAMDSAIDSKVAVIRRDLQEANAARLAVRDVVGDVVMDSAEEIYTFALDHMTVEHKDVTGVPALRALFNVASVKSVAPVAVAMDSAGLAAQFPEANRFRQM